MKTKRGFLILIAFLFCQSIFAQDKYELSGTVKDSISKEAIEYINITLLSSDSIFIAGTITDKSGYFSFKEINTDTFLIRTNSMDYETTYRKISLNKSINIAIFLLTKSTDIEEIEISAEKQIFKLEGDKRIYLTANDQSIQNAFAGDALENAPGVYSNPDGTIVVRGQKAEILIDGKVAGRDDQQIKNKLDFLPASNIERIEVITNPGASYTATNSNVIINIVLRKYIPKNSLFALGTVINTSDIFEFWATAFITKRKFDFNIYASISDINRTSSVLNKSYTHEGIDTSFYSKYSSSELEKLLLNSISSEITYRINSKISIKAELYYSSDKINTTTETELFRKFDKPFLLNTTNDADNTGDGIYGMLEYNHLFNENGHTLSINIMYDKDLETTNNIASRVFNINNKQEFRYSPASSDYVNTNIICNYALPINEKINLSSGFTICAKIGSSEKIIVDTVSINSEQERAQNITLSRDFKTNTSSYEIYSTINGMIHSINYTIGLRYEYNMYNLKQIIPEYTITKKFTNLYPSISLSYQTKKQDNISIGYSRRVNTPIDYLNPYIDRSTDNYITSGNPNLKLASVNSYEFDFLKNFKKSNIMTSLYYQTILDDISSITNTVYDSYFYKNVVFETYANCADTKASGLEINYSLNLGKNIKLNLNTNNQYKQIKGIYNNLAFENSGFENSSRITVKVKLFKIFNLAVSPTYSSSEIKFFQNSQDNFYVNASLQFDLLHKKFGFDIRARDILGTKKMINEYYYSNFYQYSKNTYVFRTVQFVAIYRIGNSQYDEQAKIRDLSN